MADWQNGAEQNNSKVLNQQHSNDFVILRDLNVKLVMSQALTDFHVVKYGLCVCVG